MSSQLNEKLLEYLKKIQPAAGKKEKKVAYKELLIFVNSNDLDENDMQLLFTGEESKKILGLCELVGKKNSTGKFKESTKQILKIIHDLMFLSKKQQKFRDDFVIYDDYIKNMLLGEHYVVSKTRDKAHARVTLEVIKVIRDKRPGLDLSEYIRKTYVDDVKRALEEYEKLKKNEDEKNNQKAYYIDKLVNETTGSISLEPKTWDEVVKLKNKKLLTTEFLSLNYNQSNDKPKFVDEDKELEEEIINNFVDPLMRKQKKLNFLSFSEDERKKMHLQYETFDCVFFLEKLYSEIALEEFAECLTNLEGNLSQSNSDDGNLIDKNIYKYLDSKKLLDFLVEKFNNQTHSSLKAFREKLSNLQGRINQSLSPLKKNFDLILKSKSSKEIIYKFSKFFMMKDKINHFLKFSNFEELADYLKKINIEIKEISQNRYIYGEFYDYFSKIIEQFKSILIKIIKESSVNDLVIKHFRYLLEFDIEVETIDSLLNGLKEKMCEKIKNDLEYTENFEIRNFKEFFCEEFNVENLNEDTFADVIKNADNYLHNITNEKYINDDLDNSNLNKTNFDKKKNLINVESIIKTLFNEIKDFLFMMKVLEENINLKIIHLSSQKNTKFSTIVTEVYFTLFEKLKDFLFLSEFDMTKILEKNYNERKVSDIFQFEDSISLKMNNYRFETDQALNLFKYYKENISTGNTLFNDNFNKNTLQNLSNLLIDLFDLFEVYLDKDTLEALMDSKNVTIEKVFMAFLNEKIISNLNLINEESTINFFDSHLSIFNFSAFSFTKTFLKNIFKSYKNIIEFYLNILKKTKDVTLNHQIVYHSLFYIFKSFFLKFYDFYLIEANGPEDYKRLNCLILEILKNYNFLKIEIKTILKTIFRNKSKEYGIYLLDLENFMVCLKNVFLNKHIENAAKILFDLFIIPDKKVINGLNIINNYSTFENSNEGNYNRNIISSSNYYFSFYDKYNNLLIHDQTEENNNKNDNKISFNIPIFTDVRSVLIEMILYLAESTKIFFQMEEENDLTDSLQENITVDRLSKLKAGGISRTLTKEIINRSAEERVVLIISDIIHEFFSSVYKHIKENKDPNLKSKNENFKLISQLYLEIELFEKILSNFIKKQEIQDNIKATKSSLFENLMILRNKKENNSADESVIFIAEEIERKKQLTDEYSNKYSNYFRCFKIQCSDSD